MLLGLDVGGLDDPADLVVDLAGDLIASSRARRENSRPRNGWPWSWPNTRGPSFSDIPKRITICLAVAVTFSRSLEAPVVTSPKMISSAARPPSVIAIVSCSSARVVRNLSSPGSEIV